MSVTHRKDKPEKAIDEAAIARVVEEQTAGLEEAVAQTLEAKAAEIRGEVADGLKEVEAVKAAGENTAALLSLSFKAQIVQDRAAKTNAITDEMILKSVEIIEYEDFKDKHAYNTIGEIFKFDNLYFEVIAKHTSNATAYPVKTTFAYYRHIELAAAGTLADPIPYPEGAGIVVKVVNGKYYSYRGAKYLAKADMPNCVYPPDTAGLWQWEKVIGG